MSDALFTLILGLILFLAGLIFLVIVVKRILADAIVPKISREALVRYGVSIAALSLGFFLLILSLFLYHPDWSTQTEYSSPLYAGVSISYGLCLSSALVGAFFFALFSALLWSAFVIHYWKRRTDPAQKRLFSVFLWGSIPFLIAFFVLMTSGIAPFLSYPLINGFEFTENGFVLTTAFDMSNYQGLHIAFYGIVILIGVAVSYFVCDHKFYQEFHKHGILDTLVLVAFPAGVIGARIWYVVGNYQREFAGQDFWDMFKIWDGGLTILGGAAAGVLAGFLFLKYRRKYVDPRWAVDVCVPSILLAQAIGRWGNFFNCEVYGESSSVSAWSWLPNWLLMQMNCKSGGGYLPAGQINIPLFFVESSLSIIGYFLIVYGAGKGLKKYLVKGDLAGLYFLWYGLVRIIMEPLRNEKFNMGTDNAWSICNSLAYIIIGLSIIMALHLHDWYVKEKKGFVFPMFSSLLGVFALVSPFLQGLTASSSSNSVVMVFGGFDVLFNHSPMLLAAYCLLDLAVVASLLSLAFFFTKKEKDARYFLLGGLAFSFVGACLFLFGKNATDLGNILTVDGSTYSVTYNISYGFVLAALFSLWSALIALSFFWGRHDSIKAD